MIKLLQSIEKSFKLKNVKKKYRLLILRSIIIKDKLFKHIFVKMFALFVPPLIIFCFVCFKAFILFCGLI